MKFEGFEGDKKAIYHGLIRDCPQVKTIYPALALIQGGIPNVFFIEVSYFIDTYSFVSVLSAS